MTSLLQIFWNRHHVIVDPYPCRIQLKTCFIYMKKNKLLLHFSVIGMYAYRSWTPQRKITYFSSQFVVGFFTFHSYTIFAVGLFHSIIFIFLLFMFVCLFVFFVFCFFSCFSFPSAFVLTLSHEQYCILQNNKQ